MAESKNAKVEKGVKGRSKRGITEVREKTGDSVECS